MKVKLNYEELLVLDWIFHFPVGSTDRDHLEWLNQDFSLLRENIWRNILDREKRKKKAKMEEDQLNREVSQIYRTQKNPQTLQGALQEALQDAKEKELRIERRKKKIEKIKKELDSEMELEIPKEKAQLLMTMIPTTFRWGTGEDAGFNLKLKLAKALWGEAVDFSEFLKGAGIRPNSLSSSKRRKRKEGGESHGS